MKVVKSLFTTFSSQRLWAQAQHYKATASLELHKCQGGSSCCEKSQTLPAKRGKRSL